MRWFVLAQYVAPDMDGVTFPLDAADVAGAIVAAGALILILVFTWGLGFALVKKLLVALVGAVDGDAGLRLERRFYGTMGGFSADDFLAPGEQYESPYDPGSNDSIATRYRREDALTSARRERYEARKDARYRRKYGDKYGG